jgi:hypothetical protein
LITQIAFRPDAFLGRAFSGILPDIQINLSTITLGADGLSLVFANNLGLNDTIVFARGPLSLSSNFSGPVGGPMDFDVVITLTTPFFYDPAAGNLLMDVRNFGGGTTTVLDAESIGPPPPIRSDACIRRPIAPAASILRTPDTAIARVW